MAQDTHTPGPWEAYRSRLDGHEWFIKSQARNLPPYDWMARLNVKLDPLVPLDGYKYVNARNGSGKLSDDDGCCPTAIEENKANATLIAAAPATAAELVRVKASNYELVKALKGIIEHRVVHQHLCECGQPECKTTKARTALVNASPHEDPDAMIGCADDKGD